MPESDLFFMDWGFAWLAALGCAAVCWIIWLAVRGHKEKSTSTLREGQLIDVVAWNEMEKGLIGAPSECRSKGQVLHFLGVPYLVVSDRVNVDRALIGKQVRVTCCGAEVNIVANE